MWSSLTSDLKEFVTSVADDSNQVLETIDTKIQNLEEYGPDNNEDNHYKNASKEEEGEVSQEQEGANSTSGNGAASKSSNLAVVDAGEPFVGGGGGSGSYEETGIIANAEDEAKRRMGLEETYTTPLLKNEESILHQVKEERRMKNGGDAGEIDKEEDVEECQKPVVEEGNNDHEEVKESVSVQPELDQTDGEQGQANTTETTDEEKYYNNDDDPEETLRKIQFIQTFDMDSKTSEITELLNNQNPHMSALQEHYSHLVPIRVSYEQFWTRYYYRCTPSHIEEEWVRTAERKRLERQEMIDAGVKSVKNIWGGAVKALQGVSGNNNNSNGEKNSATTSIYEKYQAELKQQQEAMMMEPSSSGKVETNEGGNKGGLGKFFGVGGRPPFALNTADSGDEDEEYIDNENGKAKKNTDEYEEESDEEEFGWGSDEEEEEEEEDVEDSDEDSAIDKEEEEDEEIVFSDEKKELMDLVEQLKMTIFEKDSELGALKASLEDRQHEEGQNEENNTSALEKEIEGMKYEREGHNKEIASLKGELSRKEEEMQKLNSELDTIRKNAAAESAASFSSAEMETAQSTIQNLTSCVQEGEVKQKEADALIMSLKAQMEESRRLFEEQKNEYEKKLIAVAEECAQKEKERQEQVASTSPSEVASRQEEESSSTSSGVKISIAPPSGNKESPENETEEENNDEDGWGDSWSDDE